MTEAETIEFEEPDAAMELQLSLTLWAQRRASMVLETQAVKGGS